MATAVLYRADPLADHKIKIMSPSPSPHRLFFYSLPSTDSKMEPPPALVEKENMRGISPAEHSQERAQEQLSDHNTLPWPYGLMQTGVYQNTFFPQHTGMGIYPAAHGLGVPRFQMLSTDEFQEMNHVHFDFSDVPSQSADFQPMYESYTPTSHVSFEPASAEATPHAIRSLNSIDQRIEDDATVSTWRREEYLQQQQQQQRQESRPSTISHPCITFRPVTTCYRPSWPAATANPTASIEPAWFASPPPHDHIRTSLYAPQILPASFRHDQRERQRQNASPTPTWSPDPSEESPTPTTATINPAALIRGGSDVSAALLARPDTSKVTKDKRPSRRAQEALARKLPTWIERHQNLPQLTAGRDLSVMLPVPEPELMMPSTAPMSSAKSPSVFSDRSHQSLESDRLDHGMGGMPSVEEMGMGGLAPSIIFGAASISSPGGTVSPRDLSLTPPFMGHHFDGGDGHASNAGPETDAGFLEISSDSSNGNSRSSSLLSGAYLQPSPSPQPAPAISPTAFPAETANETGRQQRVKLPRPSMPPALGASEGNWESSGEDEAEDGEAANEPMPEVGKRQVPDGPMEGSGSEALRRQQAERTRQDTFLVAQRRAGLTYREIRRLGGFEEAESTLRGRYRTLTKPKEQRVRQPKWSADDDQLLVDAVRRLARGTWHAGDDAPPKISWKAVAESIAENGGSYRFGNTTCHKRWNDLRQKGLI